MNIILYLVLLYVGIGLMVGGCYVLIKELEKIVIKNEVKITNFKEWLLYLADVLLEIVEATLAWPIAIVCIVKWFRNIKNEFK